MSRPALMRMLSLGNALAAQERAAAADAAHARALADEAHERAQAATARAASARGHGGEVGAFLLAQMHGTAAAQGAVDAAAAADAAQVALEAASQALTERRIQLKAVQRIAQSRADSVHAADLAAAQALVDDAVTARAGRARTTGGEQ